MQTAGYKRCSIEDSYFIVINVSVMRERSSGGGLDAMLLRGRGRVGRARKVQNLSALEILGCVTLCQQRHPRD